MPSLTREIPHGSSVERYILQELQRRVRFWESGVSNKVTKWWQAEEKVLAYLPEGEADRVRKGSRDNGLPQYTTIQIPYSYAVVMAAHTYLTSVFFGRDPVFQFSGRHGETAQQVQAMEALIDYQVLVGRMKQYLYTWYYDSLKYGVGIVGNWWEERIDAITTIQEFSEPDPVTGEAMGKPQKYQVTERQRTYAGNRVYNVQPQHFIWDVRHTMREFQAGEYCGEKRKLPWNEIVRRQKQGYYMNIEDIKKSSGRSWDTVDDGSSQLERPETVGSVNVDGEYSEQTASHPAIIGVYQLCVEVIPNEWRLSQSDYPEKWVFTCTDDWGTLIGAQPLGAKHCKFPYSVAPLEPEGYGLTTRGMPEILEPIQNTADWIVNSHFYNVRAALNDRWIADPSKIVMKDLTDPLPGKIVRLKPEAYGTDPKLAIAQFPVSNVTQGQMNTDLPMIFGLGERTGGVNDSIMGMQNQGGRKTATEVRTSTSFGINRLKTVAEFFSAVAMDPLSMMIVTNTQQYYDMELKFKIAGDLALGAGQNFLMVNPQMIDGAFYDFVPVDGTLPIDRFAQVQLWQELMQVATTNPSIAMGYDWAGIFTWVAQLAGLKNITQFKIQVMPDAALQQQAQAGNTIPMNGAGPQGASIPRGAAKPTVSMPAGIM